MSDKKTLLDESFLVSSVISSEFYIIAALSYLIAALSNKISDSMSILLDI